METTTMIINKIITMITNTQSHSNKNSLWRNTKKSPQEIKNLTSAVRKCTAPSKFATNRTADRNLR
jgi:hypothetical protein